MAEAMLKSANHNRQPTVLPTQHTKIGNSVGLENLKPICTMAKSMLKNETKCTASCSTNTENLGHVDTEKRAIDCHAIGSRGYTTQAQDFADTAMEVHLQGFLCTSESITSIISSYQTTYEEYRLVRQSHCMRGEASQGWDSTFGVFNASIFHQVEVLRTCLGGLPSMQLVKVENEKHSTTSIKFPWDVPNPQS